jgi:hypothetical protein
MNKERIIAEIRRTTQENRREYKIGFTYNPARE